MKTATAWFVVLGIIGAVLVAIALVPILAILGALVWAIFNH